MKKLKTYLFSFPVDKGTLEQHFLEGKTFDDCYKDDRLFYIDYKDFEEYIAKASNAVSAITNTFTSYGANMTNKFNSLSTNLTKWLTVTRLTDSTKNLRVCRYLAYSMSQTVSGFNFYDGWFFFCNEGQEKRNTF